MQDDGTITGQVLCPHCRGAFTLGRSALPRPPAPPAVVAGSFAAPAIVTNTVASYSPPGILTTPLLISAIGNIFVSLIWIGTCVLSFMAIPCIVLCVFEFILYAKADTLGPRTFVEKARAIAIFEVIVGLFSTPSFVCGIIILVNAPKLRRRYAGCG